MNVFNLRRLRLIFLLLCFATVSQLSQGQHMLFHLLGAGQPIANFTSASQTVAESTGVWAGWSSNLSAWTRRRQILVDGVSGALTDFPVMIKLDSTRIDYGQVQSAGQDLRFTNDAGTLLSYQIEKWDAAGTSIVWVKVPTLSAYPTKSSIWMYYGNAVASDAQSSATWDANHRGVWHLSGNGNDATSNANNGTVTGAVSASSQVGNGLSFSSAGDRVQLPDNMISNNSVATIEGWFKTSSTDVPVFGWSSTAYPTAPTGSYVPSIYIGNDGKLRAEQYMGSATPITTSGTVNDGAWHHVALAINSTTQSLYLDGQLVGTLAGTVLLYSPMKHYIGLAYSGGTWPATAGGWRTLNGSVDELRISTNARSADWIQASYLSARDELTTFRSEETPTSGAAIITVQLNTSATTTITIPYTVSGTATAGTDHSRVSGNLIINGGSSSGSLNTYVLRDNLVEGSETAILTLGAPTGASLGPDTVHTVTITDEVLSPPDAVDDSINVTNFSAVTIPVLSNDTDANGDTLTITAVGSPTAGTAVRVGQTIRYTPTQDFPATDSFTYTISDGRGGTDTATVTVNYQIPFTWIGSGADANWTTTANWLGGVVPGASDTAYFNNQCTTYCNPSINGNVSVAGIRMNTSFSGTIAQNNTNTITIGTSGWTQRAGTFTGGDSAITLNTGLFAQTGGTFTATTGTMLFTQPAVSGNLTLISIGASATFAHNSGTVQFNANSAWGTNPVFTIDAADGFNLNNVVLHQAQAQNNNTVTYAPTAGRTINVIGSLTHGTGQYAAGSGASKLNGLWQVQGNLNIGSDAVGGTGSITLTGTAAQAIVSHSSGYTADLVINKTSGTATAGSGTLRVRRFLLDQGTFVAPSSLLDLTRYRASGTTTVMRIASGTTFTLGTANLNIAADSEWGVNATYEIDVPDFYQFNAITLGQATAANNDNLTYRPVGARTIVATGALAFGTSAFTAASAKTSVSGLWEARANYSVGTEVKGGTASVTLTGTAAQSVTIASTAIAPSGTFTVNKASGTASLTANAAFNVATQDVTIASGTLNLAGFNIVVNDVLTIGASGLLLCNGGTPTYASAVVNGQMSCGPSLGITWLGTTGDGLWSTAGNWTNNTIPGASDIAYFNGSCTNCNATINGAVSVKGIVMASTYTGTLTQGAGNTVTVGTSGWSVAGGTFVGSDAAIPVTGAFVQTGGTFTSTSATITAIRSAWTVSGGTFNHGGGTVKINNGTSNYHQALTPGSANYNNVYIDGWGSTHTLTGTWNVTGTLTVGEGYGGALNGGTIVATGAAINFVSKGYGGSTVIRIAGSSNQTITGVATAQIPVLEIASTGGTVTYSGTLWINGGYTYTSGTIDTTGTTVIFTRDYGSVIQIVPGATVFNNVSFTGYSSYTNITGTLTVGGTLTISDTYTSGGSISGGTIVALGDVTYGGYGKAGTALVKMAGSGNQTLTGVATSSIGAFEIVSTGGTVSIAGTPRFTKNFTYTSGTIDAGTSMVTFYGYGGGATGTITSTAVPTFNNVSFIGTGGNWTVSGTLVVGGTLSLADTSSGWTHALTGGTILVYGNVTASAYGMQGNTNVRVVGSSNQTVSGVANAWMPSVEIASTGGTVTLDGTVYVAKNYVYASGTLDPGTSTLIMNGNGGTAALTPGPTSYNAVVLAGYTTVYTLTGTLNVNGTLTFNGSSSSPRPYYNSGAIVANGDVVHGTNGVNGSSSLTLGGTTNTTFGLSTGGGTTLTGTYTVNKTGGAKVTLATNLTLSTAGQDLSISAGTLDLGGYVLSVADVLTVNSGTTLKCSGGTFTNGTLSNSGTINCPGYSGYEFNWTGAGGNSNWDTAANWQGGIIPGASDTPAFQDTYCGANCNATMNVAVNIKGLQMLSPYTGTITQASGVTVTVGTTGWTQAAGTFVGGDSDIVIAGGMNFTAGTFTSTSTMLQVRNTTTIAGTFNHGNGKLRLGADYNTTRNISLGTLTLKDLEFYSATGYDSYQLNLTGTVAVLGDLNFNRFSGGAPGSIYGGTLNVSGNITSNTNYYGSMLVRAIGSTSQTISGTTTSAYIPNLVIASTGGTVSVSGTLGIYQSLTYTSGTVSFGTSTVTLAGAYNASYTLNLASLNFYNLTFLSECARDQVTFTITGSLNVGGDLGFVSTCATSSVTGGQINVSGSISTSGSSAYNGTAAVYMIGSSAATMSQSGSGNFAKGNLIINKSGGAIVTQTSNIALGTAGQNLTIQNGTLNMAGYNLNVAGTLTNSSVLQRGTNPSCGTVTAGTYSGTAAICP